MVSEHLSRNRFSGGLLSYMFGLMYNLMYCMAIGAGLLAQTAADSFPFHAITPGSSIWVGGYTVPFDMSIGCLICGMVAIVALWGENYGSEGVDAKGMMENFSNPLRLLKKDNRTLLLCVVVSCFEGSMYSFVFNWTPALESKEVPPPYGLIFSLFMMACMCGASVATIVGSSIKPAVRLTLTFALGVLSFLVAAGLGGSNQHLMLTFISFLIFEFCCGVYFPTVGVLKSEIVPEQVRGTMYNIYRVPLNGVVVCLLLTSLPMIKVFYLCATFLGLAAVAVASIAMAAPRDGEEGNEEFAKIVKML
jgi:hypothetical protein